MDAKILEGKVCLITGAASGMGLTTARLFASEGAIVYLCDLPGGKGAEYAAEIGPDAEFAPLNVTSEENWAAVVGQIEQSRGRLDVLVNCAGITGAVLDRYDLDYFRRLFEINTLGSFAGIKYSAPLMEKSGGGSIINISSVNGLRGAAGAHFGYGASKAAVTNLTKSLAIDLAPGNIRVNSVHPGTLPPMAASIANDPAAAEAQEAKKALRSDEYIKNVVPLGRIGSYEETAQSILFLASPMSTFVTGAQLVVDGGFLA